MKFTQAQRLLQTDINNLDEYELYDLKGKLNTLYHILKGTHGEKTLFDGGYIVPMIDCGAKGFVPKDKFMFTNLSTMMDNVEEKLK